MSVSFKTYLHAALTFAQPESTESLTEDAHWSSWQEFMTKEPSDSGFTVKDRLMVLQILAAPTYTISANTEGLIDSTSGEVVTKDIAQVVKKIGASPTAMTDEFTSVVGMIGSLALRAGNNARALDKFNAIKDYLAKTGRKIPFQREVASSLELKQWKDRSRETNLLSKEIIGLSRRK